MNDSPADDTGDKRAALPVESRRESRVENYQREPQGYGPYGDEDTRQFNIYKYLQVVLKYKWLVAGVTLLLLAITAVSTFLQTPIYQATAIIQIDREATRVIKEGDVEAPEAGGMEFYQTQYQLLSSRSLAERVAVALALADDAAFNKNPDPSVMEIVRERLSGLIFSPPGSNAESEVAAPAPGADSK